MGARVGCWAELSRGRLMRVAWGSLREGRGEGQGGEGAAGEGGWRGGQGTGRGGEGRGGSKASRNMLGSWSVAHGCSFSKCRCLHAAKGDGVCCSAKGRNGGGRAAEATRCQRGQSQGCLAAIRQCLAAIRRGLAAIQQCLAAIRRCLAAAISRALRPACLSTSVPVGASCDSACVQD
jgi:hypothetical protein